MSFKKNKSRQVIVKSKSSNNSEEYGEENDKKLVINNNNIIAAIELILGFSQKQVIDLIIMISIVINARFEQRFGNFNTNRQ